MFDTFPNFDNKRCLAIIDTVHHNAGFTAAKRLQDLKKQCHDDKRLRDFYWNDGTDQGEPWIFVPVSRLDMFFTGDRGKTGKS